MQLVDYINTQIGNDQLKIDDRLPSLNQLTKQFNISKETALKGLGYLSEKGIIESEYRKGYYVKKKTQYLPYRVCLILDKMNVFREKTYHSFLKSMQNKAEVDVFFHHHNFKFFEKLIEENLNNYTHLILITFFKENPVEILDRIPPHKRVILDHQEEGLKGDYTCIYQDHKSDIVDSLTKLLPQLEKYKRLVLITPTQSFHAKNVIEGFETFNNIYKKNNCILNSVDESNLKLGDAYITFNKYDQDDVDIIKISKKKNWKLGKDVGLISYNDTDVKEILENGITVISTDFNKMGELAAKAILDKEHVTIRVHAKVILRNSL